MHYSSYGQFYGGTNSDGNKIWENLILGARISISGPTMEIHSNLGALQVRDSGESGLIVTTKFPSMTSLRMGLFKRAHAKGYFENQASFTWKHWHICFWSYYQVISLLGR